MPVGVVDIVKMLDNYPKFTEGKQQLDLQFKAALAPEEKNLGELKSRRETLQPGTPERAMADNDYESTYRHYQNLHDILQQKLRNQFELLLVECYEDAGKAIANVAKDRQLAMVLRRHDWVGDGSTQEKAQVFERRVVWQANPEMDVTGPVISRLQVQSRIDAKKPEPSSGR